MFKRITFRRLIQAVSLSIFILLIIAISLPVSSIFANKLFSIFLMTDPLSALAVSVASRQVIIWAVVAIIVSVITIIFGRVFCGYFCPMGTTIDIIDKLRNSAINKSYTNLNPVRYVLLVAIITASFFGLNAAFHLLPISLVTRLYGLLVYPVGSLALSEGIGFGQNVFGIFGYFTIGAKQYSSILFLSAFVIFLFIVAGYSKRFWCRYICPTGAFLGLFSTFCPYKRRVNNDCIKCSKCEENCPTAAIKEVFEYEPQTCISCKDCVNICPVKTVSFNLSDKNIKSDHHALMTRRNLLSGAIIGGGLTLVSMSELKSLLNVNTEHGQVVYEGLIRPPGAVPENDFLAKCIRCGQCMVSCPTNALQPVLMQSGSGALFSPVLVPLRGKCETSCNICGIVCPTGAIKELPLKEKEHAKIGTARIKKERCLAWEENQTCMVCDEVCPYNAITLTPEEGYTVTVPRVDENRCFGCGACEHSCPPEIPAIIVEPVKALRLDTSDYIKTSKERGLDLTVSDKQKITENIQEGDLPPGFVE